MIVSIRSQNDLPKAHEATVVSHMGRLPTFVVVKAEWCPHCRVLEEPLKTLGHALKDTGMNMLVVEADALHRAHESPNHVIRAIQAEGFGRSGVPSIGMRIPGQKITQFNDHRTAMAMGKFIVDTLKRHVTQSKETTKVGRRQVARATRKSK
jgi:thioredoxin-like negative regulator of GroEL